MGKIAADDASSGYDDDANPRRGGGEFDIERYREEPAKAEPASENESKFADPLAEGQGDSDASSEIVRPRKLTKVAASDDDAPTRIGARSRPTTAKKRKRRAAATTEPALTPEQKEQQLQLATQERHRRERREAEALRKEKEIMRSGIFFQLRREALNREREVREVRKRKLAGKDQVAVGTQLAGVDNLGDRQDKVKALVRRFYQSREHEGQCIGEVQVLMPQYNIGYVTVLGDEIMLPENLQRDDSFLTGKNARRMLLDGSCLLLQCCRLGDIVRFEYSQYYQGMDMSADDVRRRGRRETEDVGWQVTKMHIVSADDIPDRLQLIPAEVRRFLLSLMQPLEAGHDLSLFCRVVHEIELWRRILMEHYTPKRPTEGLVKWHVLLIITIASRRWLDYSNMNMLLWSFFNSFTDSRFLKVTLPALLHEQLQCDPPDRPFSPRVLVQIARFLCLYRKHACRSVQGLVGLVQQFKVQVAECGVESVVEQMDKELTRLRDQTVDADHYADMLLDAARNGMNATKAPTKQELFDFDEERVLMLAGEDMQEADDYNVLLTLDDLREESALDPDKLPKNKVEGSWASPTHYAKSQFDLLRADAFKEFQLSMFNKVYHWEAFRNMQDGGQKRDIDRPSKMFKLVDMLGVSYLQSSIAGRLCYVMRFKHYEVIPEQYLHMMLEKGNLVGITTDRFKTNVWWGAVSHRDQQLLSQGIVGIEFIKGDPIKLRNQLQSLQERGEDKECWLVEAQTLFFAGYRPVLEALKEFGQNADKAGHCPFEEYLVYGRSKPTVPGWVKHNKEVFKRQVDLCVDENTFDPSQERAIRALENNFLLVQGPPGTGKSYTGVKMVDVILRTRYAVRERIAKTGMKQRVSAKIAEAKAMIQAYAAMQDESERLKQDILALRLEMQRKRSEGELKKAKAEIVALIKKREAIKEKMRRSNAQQDDCFNRLIELEQERQAATAEWEEDSGPIQVITYKNHSLDEFLMDVKPSLEDHHEDRTMKQGLVRFGSRSQCEELERYNIKEVVRAFEAEPNIIAYRKIIAAALRQKTDELKNLGAEISHLDAFNLTRECMECSMTEVQKRRFGDVTDMSIARWRGREGNPALVSLQDAARIAQEQEMERESDDDVSSVYSDERRKKEWQRRQLQQTKGEQEAEDTARERFMGSFSPVLPDAELPPSAGPPAGMDPTQIQDLDTLTPEQREQLATFWIENHRRAVLQQYGRAKCDYVFLLSCVQELAMQVKVDAVQSAQVIGLTTTGCTINKEILNKVQPSVLIIEEAAEILESQILSCLNAPSIQQMVLIGDHKQLRPIVSNYDIAKKCRLDLSLFERMANNSIPVHNLTNQRRMVPQISQLVRPLYRQLVDDDCLKPRKMVCENTGEVRDSGNLPGLGKPVWFWTHEQEEEPSAVGLSVVNTMEVRMTVWLVKFFHARGVGLRQITVLTPYKGQLRELRESLEYAGVHHQSMVCTVDRFQGDENDLVIVSLVRNARLTEFIKAPDRMCVTLSRARFGMVILGNAGLLDRDPSETEMAHWAKTIEILRANSWVGETFPCMCDRHPNKTHDVEVLDILKGDVADGKIQSFCNEQCRKSYRFCLEQSTHKCHRNCHTGAHDFCPRTCGRYLDCGHRCKQTCGECATRGCLCTQLTAKESLGCGHFEYSPTLARTTQVPFEFVPHSQRRLGCRAGFRPCQRTVYKPRPPDRHGRQCGHFIRMRCCDDLAVLAAEPCQDCMRDVPPVPELEAFLGYEVGGVPFSIDCRPELVKDTERSRSRARSMRSRSQTRRRSVVSSLPAKEEPGQASLGAVPDPYSEQWPRSYSVVGDRPGGERRGDSMDYRGMSQSQPPPSMIDGDYPMVPKEEPEYRDGSPAAKRHRGPAVSDALADLWPVKREPSGPPDL